MSVFSAIRSAGFTSIKRRKNISQVDERYAAGLCGIFTIEVEPGLALINTRTTRLTALHYYPFSANAHLIQPHPCLPSLIEIAHSPPWTWLTTTTTYPENDTRAHSFTDHGRGPRTHSPRPAAATVDGPSQVYGISLPFSALQLELREKKIKVVEKFSRGKSSASC